MKFRFYILIPSLLSLVVVSAAAQSKRRKSILDEDFDLPAKETPVRVEPVLKPKKEQPVAETSIAGAVGIMLPWTKGVKTVYAEFRGYNSMMGKVLLRGPKGESWIVNYGELDLASQGLVTQCEADALKKGYRKIESIWLSPSEQINRAKQEEQAKRQTRRRSALELCRAKSLRNMTVEIVDVVDKGEGALAFMGSIYKAGYILGFQRGTVAEGEQYRDDFYWCGNYHYTNRNYEKRIVPAYALSEDFAVEMIMLQMEAGAIGE